MFPRPISDKQEASRQALRMRRFLMAIGTSFLVIGLMYASYLEDILSGAALLRSAGLVLLADGIFYILFRSGLNLRCADPSLTVPQMRASTLVMLYTMYMANGGRAVFLVILLMIFLFGVLRLTTRSLLGCAAVTLTGYAGVIGLLWLWRPQALNLSLELLQWCALAITLPWFAVMGGFIGGLRTKLHKRNEELQGLVSVQKQVERRQAMEHAVTLLLGESATLDIAVPRIMQTMCETLIWDCGAFWHCDKQAQSLACAASWSTGSAGMAQFLVASSQQNFTPGAAGLIRRVWMSGEPVWIADVCMEPGFLRAGIAAQAGLHAAFAFPVRVGAELYGVMEFFIRDVRQPDPALLATARSIGSQIGQFIARKAAEDEIRQLAFYDPLTQLPNRRLLIDRLHHALAASIRSKRHGALLFIDLDHFKTINDTLGHGQGDLLLQQVAERLSGCVRAGDTVARQGGDEFVIMLGDLSEALEEAVIQTEVIGEKIRAALNQPYLFADHVCHNTASIGATLFDGQLASTDEQLKRADRAMYQAKAAGRNALRFFETD